MAGIGSAFLALKAGTAVADGLSAAVDRFSASNSDLVVTAAAASAAEDAEATSATAAGAALDFALGPIGLAAAAAGGLAAVLLGSASSTSAASEATGAYTAALQEDNGALGENVKLQAAKALSDAGAFSAARQLGISQATLTQAVLGQAPAVKDVTAAVAAASAKYGDWTQAHSGLTGASKTTRAAVQTVTEAVSAQSGSVKSSVQNFKDQQAALGGSSGAAATAVSATDKVTTALAAETAATTAATNALTLLNGGSLSLLQAQTAQAASINSVTSSIKTNGTAITGNTAAAVANQQAIQATVTAVQANAQATLTATGSQDRATQAAISGKAALENQLKAQGQLTPAVQHYIDTIKFVPTTWTTKLNADDKAAATTLAIWGKDLSNVPRSVQTEFSISGVEAASAALRAVSGQLNALSAQGSSVANATAAKVAHAAAANALTRSHGGPIAQHFAEGGVSGQVWGSAGSATSDSIVTALSVGETVTSSYASSYPGVAPLLQAINADPKGTMQALGSGGDGMAQPVVNLHFSADASWLKDAMQVEVKAGFKKAGHDAYMAVMGGTRY